MAGCQHVPFMKVFIWAAKTLKIINYLSETLSKAFDSAIGFGF
jgi:hypothetical protein